MVNANISVLWLLVIQSVCHFCKCYWQSTIEMFLRIIIINLHMVPAKFVKKFIISKSVK